MSNIFERLNNEQRQAVCDIYGPSMVLAGPGSGKTYVLVARTVNMINNGIPPENILLFTFTKKAANEIRDRIHAQIGNLADKITIGTYHSVCNRILRKYYNYVGLQNNYTIYDDEDSKKLLKSILNKNNIDIPTSDALKKIKNYKSKGLSVFNVLTSAYNDQQELLFAKIYNDYEEALIKNNAIDFENIILKTILLLRTHNDIKQIVNSKYQYIVSDEAQDSSICDLQLIRLLTNSQENVCLIGDDDQSIYGFRGADIDAVMNMRNIYPSMKMHVLVVNYRSTQMLVGACNSLISNNKKDYEKVLQSSNELGNPILFFEEKSTKGEALRVVKIIKTCINKYKLDYKDIAILYRFNHISKDIENALFKYNIPYEIINGINIYERKEIKDIVSFLNFAVNPYDAIAFERAVSVLKKGVGPATIKGIIEYSVSANIDLFSGTYNYINTIKLNSKIKNGLEFFINVMTEIKNNLDISSPSECIELILELTGYIDNLSEDEEERKENLINLIDISSNYETIYDFIENINYLSNNKDSENNTVKLLTMHNSKGLEFNLVIIVSAIEGVVPSSKALTEKDIEEERRIFYVACTRAKKLLFFIAPKYTFNKGRTIKTIRSRFLDEININNNYIYICNENQE